MAATFSRMPQGLRVHTRYVSDTSRGVPTAMHTAARTLWKDGQLEMVLLKSLALEELSSTPM
jgi:hypothetical protein